MQSTLNYSKIGAILNAVLILSLIIYIILFPPLGLKPSAGQDDGLANLDAVEKQLNELVELRREDVVQLQDLRRIVQTGTELITRIGSLVEEQYGTNLGTGDLIIEAGINHDESLLLIGELERRFKEREE